MKVHMIELIDQPGFDIMDFMGYNLETIYNQIDQIIDYMIVKDISYKTTDEMIRDQTYIVLVNLFADNIKIKFPVPTLPIPLFKELMAYNRHEISANQLSTKGLNFIELDRLIYDLCLEKHMEYEDYI